MAVVRDLLLADIAHVGPTGTGHPVATFLLEELKRKLHNSLKASLFFTGVNKI